MTIQGQNLCHAPVNWALLLDPFKPKLCYLLNFESRGHIVPVLDKFGSRTAPRNFRSLR